MSYNFDLYKGFFNKSTKVQFNLLATLLVRNSMELFDLIQMLEKARNFDRILDILYSVSLFDPEEILHEKRFPPMTKLDFDLRIIAKMNVLDEKCNGKLELLCFDDRMRNDRNIDCKWKFIYINQPVRYQLFVSCLTSESSSIIINHHQSSSSSSIIINHHFNVTRRVFVQPQLYNRYLLE
ncbi:unnamed protein product, partial [Mesorhabditis belari]|uniref:Uncharacterized protein n=1 Tax=Mesorhabditis belari TaxID=2138241 RepID=A0AAF3FQP5_9BILA